MRKVRKSTMQPVTVGSFSLDGQRTTTWGTRYPAIATILRSSALDAYLLQEVSAAQMEELGRTLRNNYEIVHYAHPTSAGGVAVLLRKERLELVHQARLPFWAKAALPDCFMCAAIAFARDRVSGARLVIASTHHDARNCAPERELLIHLKRARTGKDAALLAACPDFASVDMAIWGGPNTRTPPNQGGALPRGYMTAAEPAYIPGGRGSFVFASEEEGATALRSAATRTFCTAAARPLPATGLPPSSQLADAVALQPPPPPSPPPTPPPQLPAVVEAALAAAEAAAAAKAPVAKAPAGPVLSGAGCILKLGTGPHPGGGGAPLTGRSPERSGSKGTFFLELPKPQIPPDEAYQHYRSGSRSTLFDTLPGAMEGLKPRMVPPPSARVFCGPA